jgi:GTP-binding protein
MPKIKNSFASACDRIHFFFSKMEYAPIVAISAKDGSGVDKILSTAVTMYRQLNTQIETSRLNQAVQRWLEECPPPSGPRTRFNVKYAVQNSVNPVSFILFCSRTHVVSESYISYLRNKIRKDLGFSSVPVNIKIRASGKKNE